MSACTPSLGLTLAATDGVAASEPVSVLSAVLSSHCEDTEPDRSSLLGEKSDSPPTAVMVAASDAEWLLASVDVTAVGVASRLSERE